MIITKNLRICFCLGALSFAGILGPGCGIDDEGNVDDTSDGPRPATAADDNSDVPEAASCGVGFAYDANHGSTFFSVAVHDAPCYRDFRGKAKCFSSIHNTTVTAYGPWEVVTHSSHWSRANCPSGFFLQRGGVQFSTSGGARTTYWLWP
jgi:hypothetical protein